LRRIVLASGALLASVGIPLIIILPVALELRAAGVMMWLIIAARELSRVRCAWHACQALRFSADGTVSVLLPGQVWQPARLLSGGILLRKVGWIRLSVALPTGRKLVLGELLRGDCRNGPDWRRLHVIWRHIGA